LKKSSCTGFFVVLIAVLMRVIYRSQACINHFERFFTVIYPRFGGKVIPGFYSVFTLKQFIQYFAEVRVGQTVAIHTRLVARSEKRFQFLHFMVNESTTQLAATFEALITHVDLKIRRAAPMPVEIAQKFDATLARDEALDWAAPICGAMRV
jgi:Thioesterase-like superfamily